jgi:hypothetical protein
MLTIEEFDSLEVGDQIDVEALFPVMIDDPLVLRTVVAEPERREFVATYCGITVARWECVKLDGVLKWAV